MHLYGDPPPRMSAASSGGLGRGLAAILTGPDGEAPGRSLRARLVHSALETLQSSGARALCGYLHEPAGEPEVFLRAPEVRSLHPTQAYMLFSTLGAAAGRPGRHDVSIQDLDATVVTSVDGERSGSFFFGDPTLDDDERSRLAEFAEIYAPVLFTYDRAPGADERVHLVLDQDGATSHAEVAVGGRTGFGSSLRSHDAIAAAAIDTVSSQTKLVSVGEVRGGDGATAFVVAAGGRGRLRMGAAPVAASPGVSAAVAVAALRAARALDA